MKTKPTNRQPTNFSFARCFSRRCQCRTHHGTGYGLSGDTGVYPNCVTSLAEMLRENRYITAAFGNLTKPRLGSVWSVRAAPVGLKSYCRRQPQASI